MRTIDRWRGLIADRWWRWAHKRCIPILSKRPEFRTPEDIASACRACQARMHGEVSRRLEGWDW